MDSTSTIIRALRESGHRVLEHMQARAYTPEDRKHVQRRFGMGEVAEIVGRSYTTLAKYEEEGRIPPSPTEGGRRTGYDIEALYRIHQTLGTGLRRPKDTEPSIIAMANFKGGSGKSTLTAHFAHHMAIKGSRVLVIDCDPQATTSQLFGFNPLGNGVPREKTLYPFLSATRQETRLNYAVSDTTWPNIKIIPSSLGLYEAEYEMAANITGDAALSTRLQELRAEIRRLAEDYDIVILDPPPALGMIALAVMETATGLIIPSNATLNDFASTVKYIETLARMDQLLQSQGLRLQYDFIRILASRFDTNAPNQMTTLAFMRNAFGSQMLATPFLASAEITNAALVFMTVLELEGHMGSPRTYKRCLDNVGQVCGEIETLITSTWAAATRHNPEFRDVA